MRTFIFLAVLVVGSSARAEVCVPEELSFVSAHVDRGRSLACFYDVHDRKSECFQVSRTGKPVKVPFRRPADITVANRGETICRDERCAKLGPKLAAAVAEVRSTSLVVSSDLAIVLVLDSEEAWSVSSDRPLDVKPPDDGKYCGKPQFHITGSALVAAWARCGRQASKTPFVPTSTIVDLKGVSHGAFPFGVPSELDDRYVAMLPFDWAARASDWDAVFTIVDRRSGKAETRTLVKNGGARGAVVKADPSTALLVWTTDEVGWTIDWIPLTSKSANPSSSRRIPWCQKQ